MSPRARPHAFLLMIAGLLLAACARPLPHDGGVGGGRAAAPGTPEASDPAGGKAVASETPDACAPDPSEGGITGLPCASRPLADGTAHAVRPDPPRASRAAGSASPAEASASKPSGSRARLLAGAATRAITPDLADRARPVYMAGLDVGLKATKVHDDLFARALVLTDRKGLTVGLIVLDLIGFFHDDVVAIREELRRAHPDARIDYLAVASTHTHAGPDVIGLWRRARRGVDPAYVAKVRRGAVEAAAEAWRARRPAEIYVGRTEARGLMQDRRLPEMVDETLLVMALRSTETGEGLATIVNWNSHPSVAGGGNTEISADFPGALVKRMEEAWGGTGLYVSGALGGQISSRRAKIADEATGRRVTPSSMALVEALGRRLADVALDALGEARTRGPEPDPILRVATREIFVPLENPLFLEGLRKGIIHPRRMYAGGGGAGRYPGDLRKKKEFEPGASSLRSEVAVVDLGAAVWALLPGEPYPELALGRYQEPQDPGADFQGAAREPGLRAMSPRPIFIVGLANDLLGYLIPKSQWDYEPPFAYGRDDMQYGERVSVGPEAAPLVMEALRELMKSP